MGLGAAGRLGMQREIGRGVGGGGDVEGLRGARV